MCKKEYNFKIEYCRERNKDWGFCAWKDRRKKCVADVLLRTLLYAALLTASELLPRFYAAALLLLQQVCGEGLVDCKYLAYIFQILLKSNIVIIFVVVNEVLLSLNVIMHCCSGRCWRFCRAGNVVVISILHRI